MRSHSLSLCPIMIHYLPVHSVLFFGSVLFFVVFDPNIFFSSFFFLASGNDFSFHYSRMSFFLFLSLFLFLHPKKERRKRERKNRFIFVQVLVLDFFSMLFYLPFLPFSMNRYHCYFLFITSSLGVRHWYPRISNRGMTSIFYSKSM